MRPVLRRLFRDRRGATAVEYGFLLVVIALGTLAALQAMAGENGSIWSSVADKVITASASN